MTTSGVVPHIVPSTCGWWWNKVSWWPETHLSRLDWLAREPQGAYVLTSPALKLQLHVTMPSITMSSGSWTEVLCLQRVID